MDYDKILQGLGLTSEWVHKFVNESNLIDPQPGPSEPGSLLYDGHRDALMYALCMGVSDRYALPGEVYKLLTHGNPTATGIRTQEVTVSGQKTLPPPQIKHALWMWNRSVFQTIDSLRTDDDSIPIQQKTAEMWGLHYELMTIHPYDQYNGKVGRILMNNHALLTDSPLWTFMSAGRQEYFHRISRYQSAQARTVEAQL